MDEKISIIVPIYNAEKYIKETIENILEQSYTNWELILINDASTDNSFNIIKKYESDKIKIINLSKNSGPAVARNAGIEKASGRYICFQDADDLWKKDKLEKQLDFMKKNSFAFTYTAFKYISKKREKKVEIPYELKYEKALKNMRILPMAVMIDTHKICKELIKMPNVPGEDTATWWNILKRGYIAYGLNECLVMYRRTDKTLTSNKFKWCRNRWKLYRKVEKLPFLKSLYCFICYAINGVLKRI